MNTRELVTQAVRERIQGAYAYGADVFIDILDDTDSNMIHIKAITEPFPPKPAPRFRITIEPED